MILISLKSCSLDQGLGCSRSFLGIYCRSESDVPTTHALSTTVPKNCTKSSTRWLSISEHLPIFHRSDRVTLKTLEQKRFFAAPQREIKPTLEIEHQISGHKNRGIYMMSRLKVSK
ncbi:hypothetical protein AVEN_146764-1 [Araneus ventricosus]|uniref:Uncharacterized protein n=1 Tax=Araneus ventricosus TaxID=182803 RepID=A0A4Y2D9A6_ARAVE|nr:hypothetical protein AVEN_146764-1 [Araneus ventricosus]